jgi:Zn-dependent protease
MESDHIQLLINCRDIIQSNRIQIILMQLAILLFSVSFHELSHGYMAEKAGDPTARMLGRITLNPVKHMDLWGSFLVPLLLSIAGGPILGWAKPVPVTRENFIHPRRDEILVSAAGPGSNFILCTAAVILLWLSTRVGLFNGGGNAVLLVFLSYFLMVNLILGVFNLIPVPPLDGSWILRALLPPPWAYKVSRLEPFGMMIVLGMVVFHLTDRIFDPVFALVRVVLGLMGIPFLF